MRPPPRLSHEPVMCFTSDDYHAMIAAGIFTEDDPIELLDGVLVPKMSHSPGHVFAVESLAAELAVLVPEGYYVSSQMPYTSAISEPEPDTKIVRGRRTDFRTRLPTPGDIAAAMEVSDSTLSRDRGLKKRVYAKDSVPIYWIVNLHEQQFEVYSDPQGEGDDRQYAKSEIDPVGTEVPVVIDGMVVGKIEVARILG